MKNISVFSLALTFAGCFLGAGYVSGQELWQFFGIFGVGGIYGLIIAVAVLSLVAIIMIRTAQITGIDEMDKVVIYKNIKWLRVAMAVLELLFLFGVCTIMTAGTGALLKQVFDLPVWIGGLIFVVIVSTIAIFGLKGLVKAFSFSVPMLAVVAVGFGVYTVSAGGLKYLPTEITTSTNPMMPIWIIGAFSFAFYNTFGNFAVMSSLSTKIANRKTVILGILAGSVVLLLIAVGVLLSLYANPESLQEQLPMLAVASELSPILGIIYGVMLIMAMFGTALSSEVALIDYLGKKIPSVKANKILFVVIYGIITFLSGLFGFGNLIGIVYPFFGYCSTVFILMLIIHYVRVKKGIIDD